MGGGLKKFTLRRVIAVDVDGTLFKRGILNHALVKVLRERHANGFQIILWSARGQAYATKAAEKAGVVDIANAIISKPGYIVDDKGWKWIKYTRAL